MTNSISEQVAASIAAFDRGDELGAIAALASTASMKLNRRYYRALRAAKALARICADAPPVEGSDYRVTLANGKDVTVFVHKGGDPFKYFAAQRLEVVSFVKVN